MVVVRFVFTYMLVLLVVEFLLLAGGMTSDREFFLGVLTALPVTIVCWMLPERKPTGAAARSIVVAYIERISATGLLSRQPQPAVRARARHHAVHGSSPSR